MPRPGTRTEQSRVHQRPPDPAEEAGVPLESKERRRRGSADRPHSGLSRPVGAPDPTADSDPYDRDPAPDVPQPLRGEDADRH